MSLFESKDYEKLYDGFNSQERDFNPSLPPLPLCSGGRTTVKRCRMKMIKSVKGLHPNRCW